MSDVLEVVIEEVDLELAFEADSELVFVDDGLELTVVADAEVIVQDETVELLTDSEPGIPGYGTIGQILAKKTSTSFDVEWIPHTKIHVGTTAPVGPAVGDLWVDTN
jgi:hypothetical protein